MRAMVTCVTISRCGSEDARGARAIDASNACTAIASSNAPANRRAPEEGAPRRMREPSVSVEIESLIRTIPDFPIPGILFRDITPLLRDKQGSRDAIDLFVDRFKDRGIA